MTDEPRTRVAVVGTGPWWGREHARVYSRAARRRPVRGGRPHDPSAPSGGRGEFGASPYVDIDEMLERERPDLVSLCLPNEGHFEPTLEVIRAGFPLFVEKPLVFDLDEADVLLREAEARVAVLRHQLQPPLRHARWPWPPTPSAPAPSVS